jgi:uncharacterized protein (TIGR03083 family)
VDHLACCDALEAEITEVATVLAASDPERPVPTCPGWTVPDLASHLGSVHRWAEQLVRERAQQRIPWSDRGDDRWPANPSWIVDGGTSLLAALRSTDPDIGMWSWGADQHVRFWSRRQLHETVIHRVDLELAMDREPAGRQAVAADGIDEFLVNLPSARPFSPGVGELVGEGSRLAFTEVDGNGRWLVALEEGGISLPNDDGPVDVELAGSAWELLLVLYRRRTLHRADVSVVGDRDLLAFWLEHSALL